MRKSIAGFCFVFAMSVATVVAAEEVHVIARGTQGLEAVPLRVENETARPVACAASIAHWYSAPVGTAAAGGRLETRLWSKPATGEVLLLNAQEDQMPIQSLWCGYAGEDVSTRSDIRLARRSGTSEPAIDLICREAAGSPALDCRRRGAQ